MNDLETPIRTDWFVSVFSFLVMSAVLLAIAVICDAPVLNSAGL